MFQQHATFEKIQNLKLTFAACFYHGPLRVRHQELIGAAATGKQLESHSIIILTNTEFKMEAVALFSYCQHQMVSNIHFNHHSAQSVPHHYRFDITILIPRGPYRITMHIHSGNGDQDGSKIQDGTFIHLRGSLGGLRDSTAASPVSQQPGGTSHYRNTIGNIINFMFGDNVIPDGNLLAR